MIEVFLNYGIAFLAVGKYIAAAARILPPTAGFTRLISEAIIRILFAERIAFAVFTVKILNRKNNRHPRVTDDLWHDKWIRGSGLEIDKICSAVALGPSGSFPLPVTGPHRRG